MTMSRSPALGPKSIGSPGRVVAVAVVVVLGAAVVGGEVEVVAATDVVVDSAVVLVEVEVVVEASHAKLTRARETMRAHLDAGMFPTYRNPRD